MSENSMWGKYKVRLFYALIGAFVGILFSYIPTSYIPIDAVRTYIDKTLLYVTGAAPQDLPHLRLASLVALIFAVPAAFLPPLFSRLLKMFRSKERQDYHSDNETETGIGTESLEPEVSKTTGNAPVSQKPSVGQADELCDREYLVKSVVQNAVRSKFRQVPNKLIAEALILNKTFYQCKEHHFSDHRDRFHIVRRLDMLQTLSSNSESLSILFDLLASEINRSEIDLIVYNKKITMISDYLTTSSFENESANDLLANIIFKRTGISLQPLIYDEDSGTIKCEIARSKEGEKKEKALEGANVVLLESLLVFPHTVIETVTEARKLGVNVREVILLVDGTQFGTPKSLMNFQACGISPTDVKIGFSLDLKLHPKEGCPKCNTGASCRVLKYGDY